MVSLTGFKQQNFINLTGMQNSITNIDPIYIKKAKRQVFNNYIIPLQTNNWKIIDENMFLYDNIYNKFHKYNKLKSSEEIEMYISILEAIFQLNGEYKNYESIIQGDFDGLAKIIQVVPSIKLLPELELYNMIIGKPKNNDYDKVIISKIKKLLKNENMTYDKIKRIIHDNQ